MSARDDIAAAMTATGLVNVQPFYRQSLKAFDGFVKWSGQVPGSNRLGHMDTWQVWLALPQDVATAEQWIEANLSALRNALHTEVIVTSINPAELIVGDGASVNGLIFEGSRAAGL